MNTASQAASFDASADGLSPDAMFSDGPALGAAPETRADGRSARWTRHREQRRAELLEVARHLIHTRGPDVTMEDIAVASGTSKSIVYRYFTDKSQLQRAIGMHILSGMHRRLVHEVREAENAAGRSAAASERIRAMISAYVGAAQASPNVYRFVVRPSDGLNHFVTSVARLVAAGMPEDLPADRAASWAAGAVGFVQGAVDRWMREQEGDAPPGSLPDADRLTADLHDWLVHGLPLIDPETTSTTDTTSKGTPR